MILILDWFGLFPCKKLPGSAGAPQVCQHQHCAPAALWWHLGNTVISGKFIKFHWKTHIKLVFLKSEKSSPFACQDYQQEHKCWCQKFEQLLQDLSKHLAGFLLNVPKSDFQSSSYYHPTSFFQNLIRDKSLSQPHYVKLSLQSFDPEPFVKGNELTFLGVTWMFFNYGWMDFL